MSRRDAPRWRTPKRLKTNRFAPAEPMRGWEEPRRPRPPRALVPVGEEQSPRERGGFAGFTHPAKLGERSVIATQQGVRAAVIPLQKGLYLVAELPAEATKSEFGLAPLLGPMMVKAAVKALTSNGERERDRDSGPRLLERLRPERRAPRSEEEAIEEAEALLGAAPDFGCAQCGGGCGGRRP